ncbi:zinc metalloprotease [Moritella sp. JT01]|uniref:M4 family metallopeptidase n=1 Tax=Moritella sp. JT01 TaxID=756698 RepID=UPI00079A29CE|nr:M4 family metallopeptidase [Moritella sp. JT01]KXO07973.1 zinc metalloprotease [Moritella sp. JT01]
MSLPTYFYLSLPLLLSGCFDSSPPTGNNSTDSIIEVSGHGGNGATGIYTYGLDELADKPLRVTKGDTPGTCNMSNTNFELRNGWENGSVENPIPDGFWSDYYPREILTFPCPTKNEILQHDQDKRNGSFSPINDTWFILNNAVPFYEELSGELPMSEKITIISHYLFGANAQYVRPDHEYAPDQFKNNILISDGIHRDGSGIEYTYSFATSDILVHELTHAYTGKKGHSFEKINALRDSLGGWSEHFSDIIAEYYQFKTTGKTDLIHGADHIKCNISDSDCSTNVRDFKNPQYKNVIDAISDQGKNSLDELEVHIIGDTLNYSFYLLLKDDNYGVFTLDELIEIYIHAEKNVWKLNPSSSSKDLVDGLISSASALDYSDEKTSKIKEAFTQTGFYSDLPL